MSKKHFIALAEYLRDTKQYCEAQNGNFNRERWLGYIAGENGPSGGKV